MQAKYAGVGGRREVVSRLLRERPWCEAGCRIANSPRPSSCAGQSVDVHELLRRSAGGSIVDESNLLCVCRPCHDWIGLHPREAIALGLSLSRYDGDRGNHP